MIGALAPHCNLRGYSSIGDAWAHAPQDETEKIPRVVLGALVKGRSKDGVNFKHVGLVHAHAAYYEKELERFHIGYHDIIRGYKTKILMTVNESEPIPDVWIQNSRIFDMIVVPSTYCKKGLRSTA
jgi:hypothetical protein